MYYYVLFTELCNIISLSEFAENDTVAHGSVIAEYYRVLQDTTEHTTGYYRILQDTTELQNITEYYRVLQDTTQCYRILHLIKRNPRLPTTLCTTARITKASEVPNGTYDGQGGGAPDTVASQ